jgi:hypothetical protein
VFCVFNGRLKYDGRSRPKYRRRLSLIMAVHQAGSSHHHHVSELPTNGAAFATFVDDLPFGPGRRV